MDKLDEIFSCQQQLDDYISKKRALRNNFTPEEWVQKKALALIDEVAELLNEVNYKWWKNPKPVDKQKVAGELIDILHFWVSMCNTMGLSANDVYKIYMNKNNENKDRQDGKSEKQGYDI